MASAVRVIEDYTEPHESDEPDEAHEFVIESGTATKSIEASNA